MRDQSLKSKLDRAVMLLTVCLNSTELSVWDQEKDMVQVFTDYDWKAKETLNAVEEEAFNTLRDQLAEGIIATPQSISEFVRLLAPDSQKHLACYIHEALDFLHDRQTDPVQCTQCPHVIGDIYERDCRFPDCVGGWEAAFMLTLDRAQKAEAKLQYLEAEIKKYKSSN